jgi:hypothetical protein
MGKNLTLEKTSLGRAVRFAWSVTTLALLGQTAIAQNTAPPKNPPAPLILDPKACVNEERLPPNDGSAQKPAPSNPTETLSEKLERSEGVICPPIVDPEIAVVPPPGGRTPVIPPPGSLGGDPTVRPK